MDERTEDRTGPTKDETQSHVRERGRLFLLRRREDAAAKLLETSEHVGKTQAGGSNAASSEEETLALVQVVTESVEASLLSLEETYKRIDRLSAAVQPVEAWADSRRRLDSVASDWDARLTAAREGWMLAAEEVPRQVAEATAQVLRSVVEENRAALRWYFALALLLTMLWSLSAFWSFRTHGLLAAAKADPVSEARPRHETATAADKATTDSQRPRR